MESSKLPLIAYLTILDKHNNPVISRNYLCDYLQNAAKSNDIPQLNYESLRMQMSMIVYSTIDVLEEK